MDTPLPLRPVTAEENAAFERAKAVAFGQRFEADGLEERLEVREQDRTLAAFDGDEIVATALAYTFRMSVPGDGTEVAAQGVAGVAVLPTHRRRGLLTRMLRHLLDDAHRRGEPVSILWASEAPIYGRFGYGAATETLRWELARSQAALRPGLDAGGRRVRFLPDDPAKVIEVARPLHDAHRRQRPGMLDRSPAWWRRRAGRAGSETLWVVVEGSDGAEAYASYRVTPAWGAQGPDNKLAVGEAVATTPASEVALWSYLLGVDLVTGLSAFGRPPDDPLPWLLADPRGLRRSLGDGLWLRLVDVGAALAARRYATDVELVVDVTDRFCPWNTGRWRLAGGTAGASCERAPAGASPDLACDVDCLGAALLGGRSLEALRRGGLVQEQRTGAAAAADVAFRWPLAPWGVTWF